VEAEQPLSDALAANANRDAYSCAGSGLAESEGLPELTWANLAALASFSTVIEFTLQFRAGGHPARTSNCAALSASGASPLTLSTAWTRRPAA
jgi:hypothetical protein